MKACSLVWKIMVWIIKAFFGYGFFLAWYLVFGNYFRRLKKCREQFPEKYEDGRRNIEWAYSYPDIRKQLSDNMYKRAVEGWKWFTS